MPISSPPVEPCRPNSCNALPCVVVMDYEFAGFQMLRGFANSWELFRTLETLAHQSGRVLALSEKNVKSVWTSGFRVMTVRRLSPESVDALNLYLRGFGDLAQWKRAHEKGPWSRWAWAEFCRHLSLNWLEDDA